MKTKNLKPEIIEYLVVLQENDKIKRDFSYSRLTNTGCLVTKYKKAIPEISSIEMFHSEELQCLKTFLNKVKK